MPFGDKTGPVGMGPMTGRGAGYCSGFASPGYSNSGGRRGGGMGMKRGGGRGHRNMYFATGQTGWQRTGFNPEVENAQAAPEKMDPDIELEMLTSQTASLEKTLKSINKRISELKENKQD